MDKLLIAIQIISWVTVAYSTVHLIKSLKRRKKAKLRMAELRRELFRQMISIDYPDADIYECRCDTEECVVCRGYGIANGHPRFSLKDDIWLSDDEHFFAWVDEMWDRYLD